MKKRLLKKLKIRDALLILLGSTIMTIAIKYVLDPAELVTGGVSGLAIIIKDYSTRFGFPIPLWVSNVLLNVPIFLFAIITDGIRGTMRTGLCWIIMSVELMLFPDMALLPDNLLLVSVYGGLLFGAATGILLSVRSTSGGTDMLASALIHFSAKQTLKRGTGRGLFHLFRRMSYGVLIAILDGIIVLLGTLAFDLEHTLYAIISIFVMGKVTDMIVNRGKSARMVLIISEKSREIADVILEELDRGVTGLHATGMYANVDRQVLLCIVSRQDLMDVKDIVKEQDPKAFMTIGNVSEVLGEGFIENWYKT